MASGTSSAVFSLVQLLDLDDGLCLRINGKADGVSRLERLQKCGWADFVAHRHRLHKALDLSVFDHEFLTRGDHCDDGALAGDGCCHEPLMELSVHISQHIPALVFIHDGFKSWHRRLHGGEGLDLTALAQTPEEVCI